MAKFMIITLAAILCAGNCLALSESEFNKLLKTSPEFKKADDILNATWKTVYANIKKEDKKTLLDTQKEWLKDGRDMEAESYMKMGYSKECAYAKATRKWAKNLEVYEYNSNLSQEDQEAGRVKADDAFWDEDDDDIPEHCRAEKSTQNQ